MMRHPARGLLVLVALICSACAPEPPPAQTTRPPEAAVATSPAPAEPAHEPAPQMPAIPTPAPDLLGWWDRPEALASIGLTTADGAAVAIELRQLERAYQTAQRQLYTVSRTQLQMLRDPQVPSGDIRRFHRQNMLALTTSMMDADIAARLAVRSALGGDRLARVQQQSPEFFRLSWFHPAADPSPDPDHPAAPADPAPLPVDRGVR